MLDAKQAFVQRNVSAALTKDQKFVYSVVSALNRSAFPVGGLWQIKKL